MSHERPLLTPGGWKYSGVTVCIHALARFRERVPFVSGSNEFLVTRICCELAEARQVGHRMASGAYLLRASDRPYVFVYLDGLVKTVLTMEQVVAMSKERDKRRAAKTRHEGPRGGRSFRLTVKRMREEQERYE